MRAIMGRINWMGLFLGGLLAGVVLNILNFAAMVIIYNTTGFTTMMIGYYYITGVMAVWLYFSIRPRYGSGLKTAVLAGFAVGLLCGLTHYVLGISVSRRVLLATPVIYVIATLVGTWIYRKRLR